MALRYYKHYIEVDYIHSGHEDVEVKVVEQIQNQVLVRKYLDFDFDEKEVVEVL